MFRHLLNEGNDRFLRSSIVPRRQRICLSMRANQRTRDEDNYNTGAQQNPLQFRHQSSNYLVPRIVSLASTTSWVHAQDGRGTK